MSKVTWRHPTPEETTQAEEPGVSAKEAQFKAQAEKLLPIANELAKLMEGSLRAMFVDERDESVIRVVVAVEGGRSLNVVDLPMAAQSVEDAPDEATHYCTGLDLAEELLEEALFSNEDGKRALIGVLAQFDRDRAFKNATAWMKLTIEHAPKDEPEAKPEA